MFHIPAHKNLSHPAAQVSHPAPFAKVRKHLPHAFNVQARVVAAMPLLSLSPVWCDLCQIGCIDAPELIPCGGIVRQWDSRYNTYFVSR